MSLGLVPMGPDDVAAFADRQFAVYVRHRTEFGESAERATEHARREWAAYFPGGRPAPGHRLHWLADGRTRVGLLWLGPMPERRAGREWIYYVEVDESARGRGYGRAAMLLAERDALAHGATELGLNVFGSNTVARRLYESVGYATTAVTMSKKLGQRAAE